MAAGPRTKRTRFPTVRTRRPEDPGRGRSGTGPPYSPSAAAARRPGPWHAYGFSHDIGGGPYDRLDSMALRSRRRFPDRGLTDVPAVARARCRHAADAIDAWNDFVAAPPGAPCVGVIAILDSRSYEEGLTGAARPRFPPGAADDRGRRVARATVTRPPAATRPLHAVSPTRPATSDRQRIRGGTATGAARAPGRLILNGLLVEGYLDRAGGNLGGLELAIAPCSPGRRTQYPPLCGIPS